MAEQTSTPLCIDTVSTQLREFIEGGNLNQIIQSDQIPLYEKCLFVDFGKRPATCRILYAGLEPNGYTRVSRNVISLEFNLVVSRIIISRFPFVGTVYAVKSGDDEFDEIVEANGGRVVHPSFWTDPIGPMEAMQQYGDRHPDVESPLKNAGSHQDTTTPFDFSPPKTTPSFFESYYLCWYLMPTTRVISTDGRLLMGVDDIVNNKNLLPQPLQLVRMPSPTASDMSWGILCEEATFFTDSKYKICEFS